MCIVMKSMHLMWPCSGGCTFSKSITVCT